MSFQVRKSLWVSPVGNNELFLNASFEDPQIAYQIVNSMVSSYVNWQINKEVLDSQVAKTFFDEQINLHALELEEVRQELREYYDSHPVPLRGERPIAEQLEIERLQAEINMVAGRWTVHAVKQKMPTWRCNRWRAMCAKPICCWMHRSYRINQTFPGERWRCSWPFFLQPVDCWRLLE
jgi:hypothetical protein